MPNVNGIMTNKGLAAFVRHRNNLTRLVFSKLRLGNGTTDPNGWARITPTATMLDLVGPRTEVDVLGWRIENDTRTIVQILLPPDVGGFWLTEAGLIDGEGDMIAVASLAVTEILPNEPGQGVVVNFILDALSAQTCIAETPNPILVTGDVFYTYMQGGGVKSIQRFVHGPISWSATAAHSISIPIAGGFDYSRCEIIEPTIQVFLFGGSNAFNNEFGLALSPDGASVTLTRSADWPSTTLYNITNLTVRFAIKTYGIPSVIPV